MGTGAKARGDRRNSQRGTMSPARAAAIEAEEGEKKRQAYAVREAKKLARGRADDGRIPREPAKKTAARKRTARKAAAAQKRAQKSADTAADRSTKKD